jgi:hypothetical protein
MGPEKRAEPYTDKSPADTQPSFAGGTLLNPVWRQKVLVTMAGDPTVEVITLLSQVMEEYRSLPGFKRNAVAEWFRYAYGEPQI